jgi:Domain of unknown function (DUF4249)
MARLFSFLFVLGMVGCVDYYQPVLPTTVKDLLVVDGFLNAADGTATVHLSHSQSIGDSSAPAPEINAAVFIKTANSDQRWNLIELDSGNYRVTGIPIDKGDSYSLTIETASGTTYYSDTVHIKSTPPIDSLSLGLSNDGNELRLMVTAHDFTGSTKFYTWTYEETYEYHAPLISGFKLIDREAIHRNEDESVYRCWTTRKSTSYWVATSVPLGQDVIDHFPIRFFEKSAIELSVRYSILVKQKAISNQEYSYLDQLKKSTENLGGIFSPTPTRIVGNLHRSDDGTAAVLGYFSAGEVFEKRYFVERTQLPQSFLFQSYLYGCKEDTACLLRGPQSPIKCAMALAELSESQYVLRPLTNPRGQTYAYTYSNAFCSDCRAKGGTTTKPAFW